MDANRQGTKPRRFHLWTRGLRPVFLVAIGWVLLALAGYALPTPDPPAPAPRDPTPAAVEPEPTPTQTVPLTPTLVFTPDVPARDGLFVSREVVTTTHAVPVDANLPAARGVALSADGRIIALTARAADANAYDILYRYDRETGDLTAVAEGRDGGIGIPSISGDGQVIAFYAWAANLVDGDTNAVQDVFVYDQGTREIERVSVSGDGAQANDRSGDASAASRPAISADGRWVAFHSRAANLVADDTNGAADVFVYDREGGIIQRVSVGPGGSQANGDAFEPAISADGQVVVFASVAANLDPDFPPPPGISQIYAHDRTTGVTRLISRAQNGAPGNGDSRAPAISADGRYAAFASAADNLVPGDTNHAQDIFLVDLAAHSVARVSIASAGIQANRDSDLPALSADGRYVAFVSAATNLVSGDGNRAGDIFLHDRLARHTSRVSVGVTAPWTGVEANGPSQGPAAIGADGRMVAFVSAATNLAAAPTTPAAHAFVHLRQDPPIYTVEGRVLDVSRAPLAGVQVAAGPHLATTDADGYYRFPALVGGTYTLAAAKADYTFSPPRRTVSLLAATPGQDFIAFPAGDPSAFLDLPLAYDGAAATFLDMLRDTDEGGLIDSWFDHDAPDYRKNGSVLLWDGRLHRDDPYNDTLGCFERRCYDGHDGVDFPYRDPNPDTPNIYEPLPIYPAAAGRVAAVYTTCDAGEPQCNGGYGNEVILAHDNGYFTRYSHLDRVDVAPGVSPVTRATVLGIMGSTGNSLGTHLHFAVHLDNGNGEWDGGKVDRPIDPFGWTGSAPDPWAASAVSRRLWRFSPTAEVVIFGSQGATLRDGGGTVTANLPADAFAGQARIELSSGGAPARPAPPQRSLGRTFRLQVLDWLQGAPAAADAPLAHPVELAVRYQGVDTRHLALGDLMIMRWDHEAQTWTPLPTVVDEAAQVVYAATDRLGEFDLQAPLRCPADRLEADDSYFAAVYVRAGHPPLTRLFDVAEDQDWLRFDASAGTPYQVTVDDVTEGVTLQVEVYDVDGLTRLAANGAGTLAWQPAADGTYFVRVAPAPGSAVGCDASYRVAITQ